MRLHETIVNATKDISTISTTMGGHGTGLAQLCKRDGILHS